MLFPDCRILAFEPAKENFSLLAKNVAENRIEQVDLYNIALSDSSGEKLITKDQNSSSLNWKLSSPSLQEQSQHIESKRLSSFMIGRDYCLKLDVEGAELSIIKDLFVSGKVELVKEMIIEFHPAILSTGPDALVQSLTECNFTCKTKEDELHDLATEVIVHASRE